MACRTEGDQVLFTVLAGLATEMLVMNLQILHAATRLATKTVPPQDLLTESLVGAQVQPDTGIL
jgi:hypothetical protein